jgi:trehalose 6-phosphate synthase
MNLIVVSNRLPFVLAKEESGAWSLEPGSGGLVTALRPVLRDRGGTWIGWNGTTSEEGSDADEAFHRAEGRFGYRLVSVPLSAAERDGFYQGFSNQVVWPLFHDLPSLCNFDPAFWAVYQTVNRRFAEITRPHAQPGDLVWVHDYHLMTMARELRELGTAARLGFFLHIPFPPLDVFLKLPWRFQILNALLEYDLLGFQTVRDRRNFLQCVRLLLRERDANGKGRIQTIRARGRELRVGALPISIDYAAFDQRARVPEVLDEARSLREAEGGRRIVLGVDRLDYTKGIPHKLEAFRDLLRRYPELRAEVTLVQIAVPSREQIARYQENRTVVERLVGAINGEFTRSGWVPIHYIHRSLDPVRLSAYYRCADVALVTPLKDGMNLVAKEYCASRPDESGALILSEFAGAAAQMKSGAILVNPFDREAVADAMAQALRMSPAETRPRMRRLRKSVQDADILWWVDAFLQAVIARELEDFPRVEDWVPEEVPQ